MHRFKLNPALHDDAVFEFLKFFKLPRKRPDLHYLNEILTRFASLPYENLSKIIVLNSCTDGTLPEIRLPEIVMKGYIRFHLGGTCFSLTYFLQTILSKLGFICYPVMADMRAGRNVHCALILIYDNRRYLVDPGYLLTRPMEIHPSQIKIYRTEFTGVELRYTIEHGRYHLYTFDNDITRWRYSFIDCPVDMDGFLKHWLASFRRNSMHGLCLTKVTSNGLLFVNRTFMRETTFRGKKNFNIKRNYHKAIHERFGIDMQVVEQAEAALSGNLRMHRGQSWDCVSPAIAELSENSVELSGE